jgi:predicted Fe-Mo cluster-binding NifX family protein
MLDEAAEKLNDRSEITMNIAVTSQNFRTITGHAGKTRRFLVYSLASDGVWRESDRVDLPKEMSMHEFKGGPHPVDAFDVVITESCGEGFIRKMTERGVVVLTTSETDPLTAVKAYAAGHALPPAEPHVH